MEPSYLKLYHSGELRRRAEILRAKLSACDLCPRNCGVNRLTEPLPLRQGEVGRGYDSLSGNVRNSPSPPLASRGGNGASVGFCGASDKLKVSTIDLHFGEEPVISGLARRSLSEGGYGGSGTVFFSFCNLRCVFCQNYQISHPSFAEGYGGRGPSFAEGYGGQGREMSAEELAKAMLKLQARGAHNINLVSPAHFIPQIIEALLIAVERGLRLPLIYNSNGYESTGTLKLLEGIIDIYLPDIKYSDDAAAWKYSGVKDYVQYNRAAIKEMHRQVGNAIFNEEEIMQQGLIVRHLVLPGDLAGSRNCFEFLAQKISPDVFVSLMAQYTPMFKSANYPEINRKITSKEYEQAAKDFYAAGLKNGWTQSLEAAGTAQIPDFNDE